MANPATDPNLFFGYSSRNIMKGGGSTLVRRSTMTEKSNVELINSLRANFMASQHVDSELDSGESTTMITTATATANGSQTSANGCDSMQDHTWMSCTEDGAETLYIPALDFSQPGLSEERSQYDITVKLFYLAGIPASRRCAHTREAIDLVLKELHVDSIDLLIVSFPGVSFDADDEGEDEEEEKTSDSGVDRTVNPDDFDSMLQTWRTLEGLHKKGMIAQLGVAEFGSERLAKFLQHTSVRPSVDQINVKDCCVVPKSLILYAKQEKIELLTHNDCMDILPVGTLRELLGPGEKGAGILASSAEADDGIQGEVEPQWVVKYTAVVKDRGVVENKGYFALADVGRCVKNRT